MIWQIGYQASLDPSEVKHLLVATKIYSSSTTADAITAAAVAIAITTIAITTIPKPTKPATIIINFICLEAVNSIPEQFVETGHLFYPLYRHPAKVGRLLKNTSIKKMIYIKSTKKTNSMI